MSPRPDERKALPVDLAAVPRELKDLPHWVLWRAEEQGGRVTKIPYQADG